MPTMALPTLSSSEQYLYSICPYICSTLYIYTQYVPDRATAAGQLVCALN